MTLDDFNEERPRKTETVHNTRICPCPICMKWKKEHGIKDESELARIEE